MPEVLVLVLIVAAWLGWRAGARRLHARRRDEREARHTREELRRRELIAVAAATYGRRGVDDRPRHV
jgi:hypothetical protein